MKVLINTVDMFYDDLEEYIKPKIMTHLLCPCCGYFSYRHTNVNGKRHMYYGRKKSQTLISEILFEGSLIKELWISFEMRCTNCKSVWETDPIMLINNKGEIIMTESNIHTLKENIFDQYSNTPCTKEELLEKSKNNLLRAYNDFVGLHKNLKGETNEGAI